MKTRPNRVLMKTGIGAVLCGVVSVSSLHAFTRNQTRTAPPAQTPVSAGQQAAEVSQAISAARVFRDAGLVTEATNSMAGVLKKYPANGDAARFQIDTQLLSDKFSDALTTYDRYVAARQRADLPVLGTLARADLKRSVRVKANDQTLVALVLERLALDGDAKARQSLGQLSDASPGATFEDLAPTISLARLKDARAEDKLGEVLRLAVSTQRAAAIQAIRDAGARSQIPDIIAVLGDTNLGVKGAAILALGALQAREAAPQLQEVFDNDVGATKAFAAVALKQLGQNSVDSFLAMLLESPVAEIRLMAATGFKNTTVRSESWQKAVRTLMSGPNPQYQVQAAEMMACCDPTAAKGMLNSALGSPNPLLRAEAAKVFESRKELADPAVARRLLGDATERVRIYGAGLALALGRSGTAP